MGIYRKAGTSRLNVEQERLLTDTINHGIFKEYITLFGAVEPIKTVYLDAIEGDLGAILERSGQAVQVEVLLAERPGLDLRPARH